MNDYFLFSVKNRLTIFNYTLYLNIIEETIIKYIEEWNLLDINYKVPNKIPYYYDFLYKVLKEETKNLQNIQKSTNTKSIVLINLEKKGKFAKYFDNYEVFIKQNKKILKKLQKNVFLTDLEFSKTNGTFQHLNCLELLGEEEEFLKKLTIV
jgi:predicted transcriptional regulator